VKARTRRDNASPASAALAVPTDGPGRTGKYLKVATCAVGHLRPPYFVKNSTPPVGRPADVVKLAFEKIDYERSDVYGRGNQGVGRNPQDPDQGNGWTWEVRRC